MNIDSKEALLTHRDKIKGKVFLNNIYLDFYNYFKNARYPKGKVVELGSGAGFLKEIIPQTITSDVIAGDGIDKVFSASKMPFANKSISAFFMLNVLHHIKEPEKAIQEMERCLKPKGKIIMIEPYFSPFSTFIYKYLHHEKKGVDFNPKQWKIPGKGRLSDANPALPWIMFVRDKKIFQQKFPKLKLKKVIPHTPFLYIISGGLSKVQLLPIQFYGIIKWLEQKLTGTNKYIAMFMTIEIEKK